MCTYVYRMRLYTVCTRVLSARILPSSRNNTQELYTLIHIQIYIYIYTQVYTVYVREWLAGCKKVFIYFFRPRHTPLSVSMETARGWRVTRALEGVYVQNVSLSDIPLYPLHPLRRSVGLLCNNFPSRTRLLLKPPRTRHARGGPNRSYYYYYILYLFRFFLSFSFSHHHSARPVTVRYYLFPFFLSILPKIIASDIARRVNGRKKRPSPSSIFSEKYHK